VAGNLMNVNNKNAFELNTMVQFQIDHWDNRKCIDMNNLMNMDYANRDHSQDSDYIVAKFNGEFPRTSNNYRTMHEYKSPCP